MALISSQSMVCRVYHSKVNVESVYVMFEVIWHDIYSTVTTILEANENNTLEMVDYGLDMLRYAISASLFLGMETERRAFASLLAKLKYLHQESEWDRNRKRDANRDDKFGILRGKHLEQDWYKHVMGASIHDNDVIDVIQEVHHLAISMKERVAKRKTH